MVLVLVQERNLSVPVIFATVLKTLGFKSRLVSTVQRCSKVTVVLALVAVASVL